METGTSIFRSYYDAIRYYKVYGFDFEDVKRKLDGGEISIGPLPPNSRWNDEGRAVTKSA